MYFNNHFFKERLRRSELREAVVDQCLKLAKRNYSAGDSDLPDSVFNETYTDAIVDAFGKSLSSVNDFVEGCEYFYKLPNWESPTARAAFENLKKTTPAAAEICSKALSLVEKDLGMEKAADICDSLLASTAWQKRQVYGVLRYALAGGVSGVSIPNMLTILDYEAVKNRLELTLNRL